MCYIRLKDDKKKRQFQQFLIKKKSKKKLLTNLSTFFINKLFFKPKNSIGIFFPLKFKRSFSLIGKKLLNLPKKKDQKQNLACDWNLFYFFNFFIRS